MPSKNFSVSIQVDHSPEAVFEAVNNVRGWWSENIEGKTDQLGAAFTFQHGDMHRSTHKITEFEPGKKVVWHTTKASINFVKDKSEWDGTEIVFDIARKGSKTELRFTHIGLVPKIECYEGCSGAWGFYVKDSLFKLITTGKGEAEPKS
jgi:Activator of Hsp90 ATPase homolog 1-like protein